MRRELRFEVRGQAQPQGSHKIAGRKGGFGRVVDGNENLPGWRDTVMHAARAAIEADAGWAGPIPGAVEMRVHFYLKRPVSAPKTKDVPAIKKPDISKLVRAIEDSCTDAGVYVDDAQIVSLVTTKQYAVSRDLSRIHIQGQHEESPVARVSIREVELY